MLPRLQSHLPELTAFVDQLANACQNGSISGWPAFAEHVRVFFTPSMMMRVEQVAPGWGQMASYADQQTLIHVTSVLVALQLLPEYRAADADQQAIMEWMVLFHDIAKVPQRGKHDYIHGFRSAAITGPALVKLGFPVITQDPTAIDVWSALTDNAIVFHEGHEESIQDNRRLPEITTGLEAIYGVDSPAVLIVKGVLLHLSIPIDPNYPTVAPLANEDILRYVNAPMFPIMKAMLLVDNDGWTLFDPEGRQRQREQTLKVMSRLGQHITA